MNPSLAAAVATPPRRRAILWWGMALALWFGVHAWSLEVGAIATFCGGFLLLRWHRFHASLLVGTAAAWLLMPLCVVDFRSLGLTPRPSGMPGCEILALVGFPIPAIGAHGGGGWRLGQHTIADGLVHAANCALLAAAAWFLFARLPAHRLPLARLVAWVSFLPACGAGFVLMSKWWD